MQTRSAETREQILSAAQKLFAQAGYDTTGVAEICTAAGVSKGAFYYHFPSKQAVFQALLKDWLVGLDQKLLALRQLDLPVPLILLKMAGMVEEVFRAADGQLPMFLEFWTQASRDKTIWQATITPYNRYQEFFASLVRQGIEEGSLRSMDAEAAARLIVAVAVGLLLQGLLNPGEADWTAIAKQCIQITMEGLGREEK